MARFAVGITGGIASGKSAVASMFGALDVVVVDADLVARAVVAPGQPALTEIARRFGPGFILANGMLNRVRMRELVFEDPAARRDLERITHPRIREALQAQCSEADSAYVIAAIPLLAESNVAGSYDWLDRRVVVDCQEQLQIERLVVRDGIGREAALRMIASQASREQRLRMATDVIENDAGIDALLPPVSRLDARFRTLAAAGVSR